MRALSNCGKNIWKPRAQFVDFCCTYICTLMLLLTKAQRCDKAKPLGNAKIAQQTLRAIVTASPLHTSSSIRPMYVGLFPRS